MPKRECRDCGDEFESETNQRQLCDGCRKHSVSAGIPYGRQMHYRPEHRKTRGVTQTSRS